MLMMCHKSLDAVWKCAYVSHLVWPCDPSHVTNSTLKCVICYRIDTTARRLILPWTSAMYRLRLCVVFRRIMMDCDCGVCTTDAYLFDLTSRFDLIKYRRNKRRVQVYCDVIYCVARHLFRSSGSRAAITLNSQADGSSPAVVKPNDEAIN